MKWTAAEVAKMNKLADQGLKNHQIAERLGRTRQSIEMKRFHTETTRHRPQRRIPAEYRLWYEKLRRCHSTAFARAELERILEQGKRPLVLPEIINLPALEEQLWDDVRHEDAARVSP